MKPYEPFSEAVREDPYPYYAALRDEAPVCWAESAQAWCGSRYDDGTRRCARPDSSEGAMTCAGCGFASGGDDLCSVRTGGTLPGSSSAVAAARRW